MRLINADALMELARNHVNRTVDCNDIARFPTVDAAPVVHAWWDFLIDGYYCSECDHKIRKLKRKPNYCERCGAKMDGGEDV